MRLASKSNHCLMYFQLLIFRHRLRMQRVRGSPDSIDLYPGSDELTSCQKSLWSEMCFCYVFVDANDGIDCGRDRPTLR